jgi:hypothetical protein
MVLSKDRKRMVWEGKGGMKGGWNFNLKLVQWLNKSNKNIIILDLVPKS